MAEKQIGLRIKLNGLNTVITDIKTLEDEIRKAKEDLREVEIGSDIFKELASEISRAEGQLRKLTSQTEGLTTEKTVEGFSKLGAGISSSFAAATAAVALFGKESEDVQKAAADAQNLLTLALSIRGVAELKTGAQIVARTIAEKAGTAATVAANTATKAFFTTLAANPYTAILTVVGLLVTAYLALGSSTEEAAEKTKTLTELQVEAEKATTSEINKLKILQQILNDENVSLEAKQGAYRQLQKLVPTLTNLTLQQAQSQGILNSEINKEIKLIELRAKQKALENFLVQEEAKRIDKATKQKEAYIKTLNVELNQERLRLLQAGVARDEVERVINNIIQQRLQTQSFTDAKSELASITAEITELENEQTNTIKLQETAVKGVNSAEEKRKKQREDYLALLQKQIKLESELLVQTSELRDLDNKILQTGEQRVQQAQGYADSLDRLKAFTELYKEALDELTPVQDNLGKVFNEVKNLGEDFIDSLDTTTFSTEKAKQAIASFGESIKKLSEGLSESDQVLLQDFANNYKEIFNTVTLLQQFKGAPLGFGVQDFQKVVTDLNLALGKIVVDPYQRSAEEIAAAKTTAKQRYEILKKQFTDEYTLYLENELLKKGLTEQEILDRRQSTREIAASAFDSLAGVGDELLKFEQGVVLTTQKVEELNKKLIALGPEARRGFIVANADQIADEYGVTIPLVLRKEEELVEIRRRLREKDFNDKEKYTEAFANLDADLAAQGIKIDELTYEERLVLLEKFLTKSVEATKTAEEKKKEAQQKTIESVEKGLETFNRLVGQLASITAQYFQFQLEMLADANKKQQEQVVGDTEAANKKRAELEEQYQKQKAEIEKRALIRSLQFQLAQAIADGAQAVLAVIEIPPLAVIVGALAAAQIALIGQQLQYAQSLAGGGRIKMGAGGLLTGPSHEYGGISYASGVNLEGGEAVMNRVSSLNYGGLLSTINQMGGGAPIVPNASGSLMEERLIQAIAKQRQEPIRAYVLGSEITNSQAINKRLDELSTL